MDPTRKDRSGEPSHAFSSLLAVELFVKCCIYFGLTLIRLTRANSPFQETMCAANRFDSVTCNIF